MEEPRENDQANAIPDPPPGGPIGPQTGSLVEGDGDVTAYQSAPVASPSDQLVDAWFHETCANRGIDVQLWNHLYEAKEQLKRKLKQQS